MIDENEVFAIKMTVGDWCQMCDDIMKITNYMAGTSHDDVDDEIARALALNTMELAEIQSRLERQLRHHFFG